MKEGKRLRLRQRVASTAWQSSLILVMTNDQTAMTDCPTAMTDNKVALV
jgi:hypothetical protein